MVASLFFVGGPSQAWAASIHESAGPASDIWAETNAGRHHQRQIGETLVNCSARVCEIIGALTEKGGIMQDS